MLTGTEIAPGMAALEDTKAYLRIASTDEDVLLGGLIEAAATICERFTGQILIARMFSETVAASLTWTRLIATPVALITSVDAVQSDGGSVPLGTDAYALDITADGDGWIRSTVGAATLNVSLTAGMAEDWTSLPAALRQGTMVLAAHLFDERDGAGALPAAVTALWRPYRRMRLAERVPA